MVAIAQKYSYLHVGYIGHYPPLERRSSAIFQDLLAGGKVGAD